MFGEAGGVNWQVRREEDFRPAILRRTSGVEASDETVVV